MHSFFVRPLCVWFCTIQWHCSSNNLNTTQDMYEFNDKISNGNGLQGLTCWAASFLELIGSKSVFTIWAITLLSQSRMSCTSAFLLECTEYRLVPYSPCMWFKNTRCNIHKATKFTTLSTFQADIILFRDSSIPRLRSYVHNHICVLACHVPLLYRCG